MSSFSNQPEEFLDAHDYWNVNKLVMDLADMNGKKTISRTGQKYMRGVLLYKSPAQIAQICGLSGRDRSYTVRKYLSNEVYPLIKRLLNLSDDIRIVYNELPLLLQEYQQKNHSHNNYYLAHALETPQRTDHSDCSSAGTNEVADKREQLIQKTLPFFASSSTFIQKTLPLFASSSTKGGESLISSAASFLQQFSDYRDLISAIAPLCQNDSTVPVMQKYRISVSLTGQEFKS